MTKDNGVAVPAIHVYFSSQQDPSFFQQLLYGIEEEGIPHVTQFHSANTALEMSYQAAQSSRLGVGIGVGADGQLILHDAKLPFDKPLFQIGLKDTDRFRALGANAARLVKGIPFKSLDENRQEEVEEEPSLSRDEIAAIVTNILKRMNHLR